MKYLCSDHYPAQISVMDGDNSIKQLRYIIKRPNWPLSTALTNIVENRNSEVNQLVNRLNNLIHEAAQQSIRQTSVPPGRRSIPWQDGGCQRTRTTNKALRRYQRTKFLANKIELQRARAILQDSRNDVLENAAGLNIYPP